MAAQSVYVMTINRSVILKSKCLKQRAGGYCCCCGPLPFRCKLTHFLTGALQMPKEIIILIAHLVKCLGSRNFSKIFFECSHIRVNRHIIVVQHYKKI